MLSLFNSVANISLKLGRSVRNKECKCVCVWLKEQNDPFLAVYIFYSPAPPVHSDEKGTDAIHYTSTLAVTQLVLQPVSIYDFLNCIIKDKPFHNAVAGVSR